MNCPNCDAEMEPDDDEPEIWRCPECGMVEDRR